MTQSTDVFLENNNFKIVKINLHPTEEERLMLVKEPADDETSTALQLANDVLSDAVNQVVNGYSHNVYFGLLDAKKRLFHQRLVVIDKTSNENC